MKCKLTEIKDKSTPPYNTVVYYIPQVQLEQAILKKRKTQGDCLHNKPQAQEINETGRYVLI